MKPYELTDSYLSSKSKDNLQTLSQNKDNQTPNYPLIDKTSADLLNSYFEQSKKRLNMRE